MDISKNLNISKERVRQIRCAAEKKTASGSRKKIHAVLSGGVKRWSPYEQENS